MTRDGTAEPISRDQILSHVPGQEIFNFPVQLTTSRIGNLTRLIHTLLYVMTIHTQRSTTDMMFVVRRLQELGRTSNTSLEICFIDLAKAYDSVDRVLLWEILAGFGVPPRMIKVIRMSHDGMRARVQLDDGDFSAGFNVCQGLRQGCVL